MNTNLYDIEDDIIDRGDATNITEALSYYAIENDSPSDIEILNQKVEQDYHNTYYNAKTNSYGTRTIKLANKDWHKLNKV
jgi:hypothetical protein